MQIFFIKQIPNEIMCAILKVEREYEQRKAD